METMIDFCKEAGISVRPDAPLCEYTSFEIGGNCRGVIEPCNQSQMQIVIQTFQQKGLPYMVLGKGSNVLFADSFDGFVVHLPVEFGAMRVLDDGVSVLCEAGALLSDLCIFARDNSLTGLEFAYGIPGSVGGAVYMNAGAYGGEMKDVVVSCCYVDALGNEGEYQQNELDFSYRHSVFTDTGAAITSCVVRLSKGDQDEISEKMEDLMGRRWQKQPLEYPSAGSTFKRPQGNYASALIDQCGLKGHRVGGAMVSEKHAGFIINAGGATYQDVRGLIDEVQDIVRKKTGYELECEVKIIE